MSVSCPSCKRPLDLPEAGGEVSCFCSRGLMGYRKYPAYGRSEDVVMAASAELEADATCLHHPDKKAEAVCEDCGIFMCGLCATEEQEETVCLSCYGARQMKGLKSADTKSSARTTQYDNIVLAASLLTVFFWYVSFLTAPAILFVVFRQWKNHPFSVVPRSRARLVLGGCFAGIQIIAWLVVVTLMVTGGEW